MVISPAKDSSGGRTCARSAQTSRFGDLARPQPAQACTTPQSHTRFHRHPSRNDGMLMVELLVALAIVIIALLPIAYAFAAEHRLALASYQRAVAMEIVDGEMEVLLAGQWRDFSPGTHDYTVHAGAATNLPPGKFTLTVQPDRIRLRWQPALKDHGGPVTREAALR
jgi:hypothetical protein